MKDEKKILNRIYIIFNIDSDDFLTTSYRVPVVYFNIYTDCNGIFNYEHRKNNRYQFEYSEIYMSGLFNNDYKFSELFWRTKENNISDHKIFKFMKKHALPKLITLYKKDFKNLTKMYPNYIKKEK